MKRLYTFMVLTLLVLGLFAQSGKKMTFQGSLYKANEPFNGTAELQFTIALDSGRTWTETFSSVSVINGLYSVALGTFTPLPQDLFYGVNERSLAIVVDGVSLGDVKLHAPFESKKGLVALDELRYTIMPNDTGQVRPVYAFLLEGSNSDSLNTRSALLGRANTTGWNRGVEGTAVSTPGNNNFQYGLYGRAFGEGNGVHYAVRGESTAPNGWNVAVRGMSLSANTAQNYGGWFSGRNSTMENIGVRSDATGVAKFNVGVTSAASGVGNGETGYDNGSYNTGVSGYAHQNTWGNTGIFGSAYGEVGVDNIGVAGHSNVNDGTTSIDNKGVLGRAMGSGVNYGVWGRGEGGDRAIGIYGTAMDGVSENWAGWFDGDVKITGQLISDQPLAQSRRTVVDNTGVAGDTAYHYMVNADDVVRGIQVDMNGTGTKFGIRGNSNSAAGDTGTKISILGSSTGEGIGNHEGVRGQAFGLGQNNTGILGLSGGAGNGATGYENGSYNNGVTGYAHSNSWGNTGVFGNAYGSVGEDNNGVVGLASVGDSTNTIVVNQGVLGRAEGAGVNKGVVGMASGGVENWAGWFDGDVNVSGGLTVDNQFIDFANYLTDLPDSIGHNLDSLDRPTYSVTQTGTDGSNSAAMYVNTTAGVDATGIYSLANGSGYNTGLYGRAAGTGGGTGVYGYSRLTSGSANGVSGVVDVSDNPTSNFDIGVAGTVRGTLAANFSVGVYGQNLVKGGSESWGTGGYAGGNGINRAFRGRANSDSTNTSEQFGAWLQANGGGTGDHYGSWSRAAGLGKNIGVYGTAESGTENWAGWFDGDVNITGGLTVNDQLIDFANIGSSADSLGNNMDSESKATFTVTQSGSDGSSWAALEAYSDAGVNAYGFYAQANGADNNIGIYANALSGSGNIYGTYSYAHGTGVNYGVYGRAQGGSENWAGYFQGNTKVIGELNISDKAMISTADDGNGAYGTMNLHSPAGSGNRISIGFADTLQNSAFVSIWQDNNEFALLNGVQNGPGGTLYGSLHLNDEFGNSVSVNGYGAISATGTITGKELKAGDYFGGTGIYLNGNDGSMSTSSDINSDANINATGNVTGVNGTFSGVLSSGDGSVQTSDRRFKKEISTLNGALTSVLQMRGVTYFWKDASKSQSRQIGVIAQEVEAIYPEFVHTDKDGYKAVNYAQMTAVLIEAVKELNAEIESLKSDKEKLEARLTQMNELDARLARLEKLLKGEESATTSSTSK